MNNQKIKNHRILSALVIFLAIYNVFYGAICFSLLKVTGVILGAIFMQVGGIVGLVLVRKREKELEEAGK